LEGSSHDNIDELLVIPSCIMSHDNSADLADTVGWKRFSDMQLSKVNAVHKGISEASEMHNFSRVGYAGKQGSYVQVCTQLDFSEQILPFMVLSIFEHTRMCIRSHIKFPATMYAGSSTTDSQT
jgi:hypothetical protein